MARPLPGLYFWAQTGITSPFCDVVLIRRSKAIDSDLGFIWGAVIWRLNHTEEMTMDGGSEMKESGVMGAHKDGGASLCLENCRI